jgi:hypothetical protein
LQIKATTPSRVLLVTTSMATRWESYQQTLLCLLFPEWRRLVIDGRRGWSPTGFVEHVIGHDVDFVVHVDEDCFVQSRDAVLALIRLFEANPELVAAGTPDGGSYYRERNPAALNLFFVVFRASALKNAWKSRGDWSQLGFQPDFACDVFEQRPELNVRRIGWTQTEPYYPLFWSMMKSGGRFLYLKEDLRRDRWSSRVRLPTGESVAEHLWYLRHWFSDDVMPGHDCSNRSRYRAMEAAIWKQWRHNPRFWLHLNMMRARRVARRFR